MICQLCGRDIREEYITSHHLFPRCFHRNRKIRKLYGKDILKSSTINVCDVCHKKIHIRFSERELVQKYNNLEAIKSDFEMIKFIDWLNGRDY